MSQLGGDPAATDGVSALALTNYGHFTSIRVDDGRVRGLELHLERLARDARTLFDVELDLDYVRRLARQSCAGLTGSVALRVSVFDPGLELGRPGADATPKILVTTRPAAALPLPPLRVASVPHARSLPQVKHVGLFSTMWHRRVVQRAGFDDALFCEDDLISEGTTWNIGFVDGQDVVWPQAPVLAGVTATLLDKVHDRTRTAPVRLSDLPDLAAAFATNTTIGVRPITAIDHQDFPAEHPLVRQLQEEYAAIPAEPL